MLQRLPSLLFCLGLFASAVSASKIEDEQKLQTHACVKYRQLVELAVGD